MGPLPLLLPTKVAEDAVDDAVELPMDVNADIADEDADDAAAPAPIHAPAAEDAAKKDAEEAAEDAATLSDDGNSDGMALVVARERPLCCAFSDTVSRRSFTRNGGCQVPGEGSMDGTGTSFDTHRLLDLLFREAHARNIRLDSVIDVGSGTGAFLTHLCNYTDISGVGFDVVASRVRSAIMDLAELGPSVSFLLRSVLFFIRSPHPSFW